MQDAMQKGLDTQAASLTESSAALGQLKALLYIIQPHTAGHTMLIRLSQQL